MKKERKLVQFTYLRVLISGEQVESLVDASKAESVQELDPNDVSQQSEELDTDVQKLQEVSSVHSSLLIP